MSRWRRSTEPPSANLVARNTGRRDRSPARGDEATYPLNKWTQIGKTLEEALAEYARRGTKSGQGKLPAGLEAAYLHQPQVEGVRSMFLSAEDLEQLTDLSSAFAFAMAGDAPRRWISSRTAKIVRFRMFRCLATTRRSAPDLLHAATLRQGWLTKCASVGA